MRIGRLAPLLISAAILFPVSASALEGIGPRVTVTGIIKEVRLTEKQKFDQIGGELVVEATNGQIVTIVLPDLVQITSEGRLSRKLLIPANLTVGMLVRVRGWRVDTKTLTASLVIITNLELNPAISLSGVIQSIDNDKITVQTQDGKTRTLTVTNETQVSISYDLTGVRGLQLTGKQVLLTLNPSNNTYVRIIRITGNPELIRGAPTTVNVQ